VKSAKNGTGGKKNDFGQGGKKNPDFCTGGNHNIPPHFLMK